MKRLVPELVHFGKWVAILAAADVLVGVAWGLLKGRAVGTSIAEALFITGGVVFVAAAMTGGGVRGRRADVLSRQETQAEMPFTGVLIGLALIAIGVLKVVL